MDAPGKWYCSQTCSFVHMLWTISILSFDLLPDMPILGYSNSAGNEIIMPKIWTNGGTVIRLSRKRKKQFLLFPQ